MKVKSQTLITVTYEFIVMVKPQRNFSTNLHAYFINNAA